MCKRHVQAIIEFPQPGNVKGLQSFLGLTNYFRRFINNYALKVSPLQELIRKDKQFIFDQKCERAFQDLKTELIAPPVLCIPGAQV